MVNCAVLNCYNHTVKTTGTDIRYYRFPKNKNIAMQWIVACRRNDKINLKNACICSIHFEPNNSFKTNLRHKLLNYQPKNCRILKDDAIPTLNLPRNPNQLEEYERSTRLTKRKRKNLKKKTIESCVFVENNGNIESEVDNDFYIQGNEDIHPDLQTLLKNAENENKTLKEKVLLLGIDNKVLRKKIEDIQRNMEKNCEEKIKTILGKKFTPGQIKKLLNGY